MEILHSSRLCGAILLNSLVVIKKMYWSISGFRQRVKICVKFKVRVSACTELQSNLNPAAEEDQEVIQDGAPVLKRLRPLEHDVHGHQVQNFHESTVGYESAFRLGDLPADLPSVFAYREC